MSLQLTVPNMACSACGDTITKAIQKIDANATVKADPKTKLVSVDTSASETEIRMKLRISIVRILIYGKRQK